MRTIQKGEASSRGDPKDATELIWRVKYHLWRKMGKRLADPQAWLIVYLCDTDKVKGQVSNWTTFFRACKELRGNATFRVTKADVWRCLAVYYTLLLHPELKTLE